MDNQLGIRGSVGVNTKLLSYNPETERAEGDLLLFGVPTHRGPKRPSGDLEELELASVFVDAASVDQLAAVVRRLINRGTAITGKPLNPQVAKHLGSYLIRAGQSVRGTLTPRAGANAGEVTEAIERLTGAEMEGLSAEATTASGQKRTFTG